MQRSRQRLQREGFALKKTENLWKSGIITQNGESAKFIEKAREQINASAANGTQITTNTTQIFVRAFNKENTDRGALIALQGVEKDAKKHLSDEKNVANKLKSDAYASRAKLAEVAMDEEEQKRSLANEIIARQKAAWQKLSKQRKDAEVFSSQVNLERDTQIQRMQDKCTKLEQTKERAVAHEIEKHKVAIFRLQQQSMGVQAQLMQLKQTQEQFQHDVLKLGTSTRLSNANSQITEKQGQDKVLKLHEQKYLHDLREMNQKIQKKKTEIGVLHRHYIADKTAHGCDWKKCPLDECRQCPYGFKLESVAEIEPETAMCKCGCKCKHVAAQADEGMNWVDIDRVVAGSGRCAVKEESQIAMCQTGRKVVGCLAGVQVELFCGCDAAYKWSFGRSQEVHVPLQCQIPAVLLPTLQSTQYIASWYQVCQAGAEVLPGPCSHGAVSSQMKALSHAETAPVMQNGNGTNTPNVNNVTVANRPFWRIQGDTSGRWAEHRSLVETYVLHDRLFEPNPKSDIKFRVLSSFEQEHAHDCAKDGTSCGSSLRVASRHLMAKKTKLVKSFGFKWAPPGLTKWIDYGTSAEGVACAASFAHGAAVCDLGLKVNVACDPLNAGSDRLLEVGCGCEGTYMQGHIFGVMLMDVGGTCAGKMQEWSQVVQKQYMRSYGMELCSAKVVTQCEIDAKQLALKQEAQRASRSTADAKKLVDMETAVHEISKEDRKVESVAAGMFKELENPIYTYTKIPGFGMLRDATPESTEDKGLCEDSCNKQPKCKSFSFNTDKSLCAWSGNKLDYDSEYVLYIRSKSSGLGQFSPIAGMKLVSDSEAMGRAENADQCKYDCLLSDECSAVSFSRTHKICVISQLSMLLGSSWDYYEKNELHLPAPTKPSNENFNGRIQTNMKQINEGLQHEEKHQVDSDSNTKL